MERVSFMGWPVRGIELVLASSGVSSYFHFVGSSPERDAALFSGSSRASFGIKHSYQREKKLSNVGTKNNQHRRPSRWKLKKTYGMILISILACMVLDKVRVICKISRLRVSRFFRNFV